MIVYFWHADKHWSFLKVDTTIIWVCVVRHAQSAQNNNFVISLQYLKENLKDEVDFPPVDKSRRFLQIDTIISKTFTYFKRVQSCGLLIVIVQGKHYDTNAPLQLLWTSQSLNHICWHWSTSLSTSLIRHIDFLKFSFSGSLELPLGINRRCERIFWTFTWVAFTLRRNFLF